MFWNSLTSRHKLVIFAFLIFLVTLTWGINRHNSQFVFAAGNNQKPCGNGVCQASQNENINTCPADCGTAPSPTPTSAPNPTPTSAPNPTPTSAPNPTPTSAPNPTPTSAPNPTPTSVPNPNSTSTPIPLTIQPSSTPTNIVNPTSNPNSTSAPTNSLVTSTPASANSSAQPSTTPVQNQSDSSYPVVSLNQYPPNPTNNPTLSFSGSANTQSGTITGVEYSLDNGNTWQIAQASDGNFNSSVESFSLITNRLSDGEYIVLIRARDSNGNYTQPDQYLTSQVTLITSPPQIVVDPLPANPTSGNELIVSAKVDITKLPIERVEISIDGGLTWKNMNNNGNKYVTKLLNLEDDNYIVMVRAMDSIGNLSISEPQTLIIDNIPPIIGGQMFTIGPQILNPNIKGTVHLLLGLDNSLEISMRGGPVAIEIQADNKTFKMKRIIGTNNWTGNVQFESQGQKNLVISATDGAGNNTIKTYDNIEVLEAGSIVDKGTGASVQNAKVSLYYYHTPTKKWYLWDAEAFGQQNPQITDSRGRYNFFAPPGQYYLDIENQKYNRTQTEIFYLKETSYINSRIAVRKKKDLAINIPLLKSIYISVPSFPDSIATTQNSNLSSKVNSRPFSVVGANVGHIQLSALTGDQLKISDYKGKNVLLSFLSSWSIPSLEQAKILSDMSSQLPQDQKFAVVMLQETNAVTNTFVRRGNYKFTVFIDKNGDNSKPFNITLLPQHIFIDRSGIVQRVYNGLLSKTEASKILKSM